MLGSITWLGESGRNARWWVTVAWFGVGAVGAGALVGWLMGLARRRAVRRGRSARGGRGAGAAGRCRDRRRPPPGRSAAAHRPPPGRRPLAEPVPRLGVRRRLRVPARAGRGHRRHHLRCLPGVRRRCAVRIAGRRRPDRRGLRRGALAERAARRLGAAVGRPRPHGRAAAALGAGRPARHAGRPGRRGHPARHRGGAA